MAAYVGIDVFFTGLMLICLRGQADCPVGGAGNTAWILDASGPRTSCGWKSDTLVELELRFRKGDFDPDPSWEGECEDEDERTITMVRCPLPEGTLYLEPSPLPTLKYQQLESTLRRLPRLAEIDRRFEALNIGRLFTKDYVTGHVQFPTGLIGGGDFWPPKSDKTWWFRSDLSRGGRLPRRLSDRLQVRYPKAETLTLSSREHPTFRLVLKPLKNDAPAIVRNRADALDYVQGAVYDSLTYLLWYYPLGRWVTHGRECPDYYREEPVVLSCKRILDKSCACYDPTECDANTTFWPPMLRPSG